MPPTIEAPRSGTSAVYENVGASHPSIVIESGWEFYQGQLGSLWEIWRGDKATDNVAWTPVTLPHCFNARDCVDPDVRYYQGPGWYRTKLRLANPYANGRTLIHFNGSGQKAQVFVGAQKVGEHVGGYDEWSVDITEAAAVALADPENSNEVPLAVLCDNSRDAETIPSDLSDFNRYGGIYRHVRLVYVPSISLQSLHLAPTVQSDGSAILKVQARLYNPESLSKDIELAFAIRDPQGHVIHSTSLSIPSWSGLQEVSTFRIEGPRLWSPDSPELYSFSASLSGDQGGQQVVDHFGIRSVEWVKNGPFKINGERLLLRGTHYHEDHAGVAAAVPDAVVRQTLTLMKEMGANFVRLGHYQQAPLVLDLCDELGLLVWEEIPWCRGGLGGEGFRQQCRDMLRNMIDQHFNHPSVILWGLGNENDWPGDFETFDTEAIRAFMSELNTLSHELDPSRATSIRRCEFCKDIVDVYSPSIWAGWYGGRYIEYRSSTQKAIQDTPHFFHAEYGGDAHAGRHSEEPEKFLDDIATGQGTAEVGEAYKAIGGLARASRDGDWSESYMVNLFDWHLKEQEEMPDLTGAAQWVFKDFSTPLRPENPVPRVNQKGLLERDGTPKESYYVYQSYWAKKPMVHIHSHSWPVRWGEAGEAKLVKVFSNCPEVELFVNGISAGVRRRESADFPAAGLRWDVVFAEGENALRAVARCEGTEIVDEIDLRYQTTPWDRPAKLLLHEASQLHGFSTLEVQIVDQFGVPCLDACNLVRFDLIGDAILLDNLGTSSGSRAVQLSNGRARISMKFLGSMAIASVGTVGLDTAFLTVKKTTPGKLGSSQSQTPVTSTLK